ncbi:MAG: FkbM family methyltransferase [Myxococcaceae bacterium]
MTVRRQMKLYLSDLAARAVSASPLGDAQLRRICHSTRAREQLHLGAIALSYARVLNAQRLRVADFGDYRLLVNIAEHQGIAAYFFGQPGVPPFLGELLRPGDACVDIGANAGLFTFFCAARVGPEGRVIAADANPEMRARLVRSLQLNPAVASTVRIESRALFSRDGETLEFFLSTNPNNTGTSSLVNHGHWVSEERSLQVQTVTLDNLAREQKLGRLRFVKVDVEDAELGVVQGMEKLLCAGAVDYLLVETRAGSEAQRILEKHGFTARWWDAAQERLLPAKEIHAGAFGDFFFSRSEQLP